MLCFFSGLCYVTFGFDHPFLSVLTTPLLLQLQKIALSLATSFPNKMVCPARIAQQCQCISSLRSIHEWKRTLRQSEEMWRRGKKGDWKESKPSQPSSSTQTDDQILNLILLFFSSELKIIALIVFMGSRQKKRSFYGQADRKGWPSLPPPYGQDVVIFSK